MVIVIIMSTPGSFSGGSCYSGHGGQVCTESDVAKATSATNALNDLSGWGNQVSAAISGVTGTNWACASEHITGPTPCSHASSTPSSGTSSCWGSDN